MKPADAIVADPADVITAVMEKLSSEMLDGREATATDVARLLDIRPGRARQIAAGEADMRLSLRTLAAAYLAGELIAKEKLLGRAQGA